MKIVHVNIDDTKGGASIACQAISKAVNKAGAESKILVQVKYSADEDTAGYVNGLFDKLKYLYRFACDYFSILILTVTRRGRFSFPYFGADISNHPLVREADVINLHWINGGFFSFRTFIKLSSLGKPVVWTLHDMWAFTGGCHYSGGCDKYQTRCETCPSLKFSGPSDSASKIFEGKNKIFKRLNLSIVTCSKWLAGCAGKSALLSGRDIRVIPNPIDVEKFKIHDKIQSRESFNLSDKKFLILFGTMNLKEERKGFVYLRDSLILLHDNYPELKDKIELMVFGSFGKDQTMNIPFKTNFLGRIGSKEKLVKCYNAADIFVAPSIEDNLPNTVMESLACGVPVVAFNIGGMPDMIEHKKNGYLAEPKSADSLAEGILWIMKEGDAEQLRSNARDKVINNYTPESVGKQYYNLYRSLLEN